MARTKTKRRSERTNDSQLHIDNHNNPHEVTAEQLGLGEVLNQAGYSQAQIDNIVATLQGLIDSLEAETDDLQDNKLDKKFSIHTPRDGASIPAVTEGNINEYTEVRVEGGIKITEHKLRNQYGDDFVVISFKEII